jgi:hypothetical protein
MKNELTPESVDTPTIEDESNPELQMFFGGRPECFYVTVSDLKKPHWLEVDESDWEQIVWVGAVDIGELTRSQHALFGTQFYATYDTAQEERYVTGIRWRQPLSAEMELELKVLLGKRNFLKDEQKNALDLAEKLANLVREADGCGDKNIVAKKRGKKGEGQKKNIEDGAREQNLKYEVPVQSIIDINIQKVVSGEANQLMQKEIVSQLKKWEQFTETTDSAITRGVRRTQAWKNYKTDLSKARRDAGMGKTYNNRQAGGKRRGGKTMEPYADVNNEGRR